MKTTAYVLCVVFVLVAAMYLLVPGGSLPAFIPGHIAGSNRIHFLHAIAALTVAAFFYLAALSLRRA